MDFLLRRGGELLAVEVKAARTFSRSQMAGLKAIRELPGVVRRILVYCGPDQLVLGDGIEVWPARPSPRPLPKTVCGREALRLGPQEVSP